MLQCPTSPSPHPHSLASTVDIYGRTFEMVKSRRGRGRGRRREDESDTHFNIRCSCYLVLVLLWLCGIWDVAAALWPPDLLWTLYTCYGAPFTFAASQTPIEVAAMNKSQHGSCCNLEPCVVFWCYGSREAVGGGSAPRGNGEEGGGENNSATPPCFLCPTLSSSVSNSFFPPPTFFFCLGLFILLASLAPLPRSCAGLTSPHLTSPLFFSPCLDSCSYMALRRKLAKWNFFFSSSPLWGSTLEVLKNVPHNSLALKLRETLCWIVYFILNVIPSLTALFLRIIVSFKVSV